MTQKDKTKEELIEEIKFLQKWIAEIKTIDNERKRAQEVLRESERLLAQAQRLAQLGNWKFIPVTGKTVWSKEMFRIYGLEPANEAPPFEVLTQMVHEEDRQRWGEAIKEGRRTGRFYNLEYRIIRPDGQCRWLLAHESMQPESKETPLVFYGTVLDITERKQAEEELQKEKQFIENIINTAQVIMLVLDKEGRIVTFNPYMEQISGYRLEEVKGKAWLETFIPKEDHANIRGLFSKAISGIQTKGNVDPVITKDGRKIEIEWYDKTIKGPDGSIEGLLLIGHDITERKQADKKIRELNERFNIIARATNDTVWDWNLLTNELWWNEGMQNVFGYQPEHVEPTIESWSARIHPEERDKVISEIHGAIDSGKQTWSSEYRFLRKDQSYAYVFDRGYIIRDDSGKAVRMVGVMLDLAERKRAEEEVRKRLQELEVFYKASIGREERILELKKEVEKLKKELGK